MCVGDHDSLFKRVFSVPAHAAGELRSVLPESITRELDLDSLRLIATSYVDEQMAHRHVDMLFTTTLRARTAYLYFLFEHQSEPDPLMPWRVLEYQHRIWASLLRAEPKRRTLPAIMTIVIHHGEQGWTSPRRFHDLIDGLEHLPALGRFVPSFELLVDDLVDQEDRALQARPMEPFPMVSLWLLRDGRSLDAFLEHLSAWAGHLTQLVPADGAVVMRYILKVAGTGTYDILQQQLAELAPNIEEIMANNLEEELIERGVERGVERGTRTTLRRNVQRLLELRFGELDDGLVQRLSDASVADLDRWFERAAVEKTLDNVFE